MHKTYKIKYIVCVSVCVHASTHNRVGQAMDLQSYIGSNAVEVYVQDDGLVWVTLGAQALSHLMVPHHWGLTLAAFHHRRGTRSWIATALEKSWSQNSSETSGK